MARFLLRTNMWCHTLSQKAAIGVYKCEELVLTIRRTLEKPDIREKYRKKFLRDYLYKIGGQSSKRVADLIREMVLQARQESDNSNE